ncbi:uncharacterized protein [Temnothorax longispinosus]|uniref:uncharacterized protein n=1 Tax=Temnothorax longispinosus TaxID=300112 RepID=UPI003A98D40C
MLRLAKRRSRKPYHLLSAVHCRRLEKLERAARNEYECLQQQNLDVANARADSDFVDEGQILAECSQTEEDEISYVSFANAVLQVVRTHSCLSTLPKDSRTLLKTPRTAHPTLNIAGGEYFHLGFETGILSILQQTFPELIPLDTLMVDFSTDGATLDGQGKIQMWPIQIRIANIRRSKPEIVGVWQGSSKPSNAQELFQYFVDEVQDVLNRGVIFDNPLKVIELRCFITDSPAQAFVLGHKGHGSIWFKMLDSGKLASSWSSNLSWYSTQAPYRRRVQTANPAAYKHFLLLHSAIRILVSSSLSEDRLDFAHTAINIFINRAENIYGPEFLSYITHYLLHLVDDARRFGSLNELSMFPYKNNMTYFRKACRKPHQHLQQIVNRRLKKLQVTQNIVHVTEEVVRSSRPWVSPVVFDTPLDSRQFQILDTGKFRISVKNQDNTVILHNSKVCLV